MRRPIHPESLLRIPLVRQMLGDRDSKLVARAVDARWHYEGIVPRLGGFNPLEGTVYYPAQSFLARWLRDPGGSARKHNENDFLVKEVLFAVHDYLHAWAYRAIEALVPRNAFWTRPVTRAAVEDQVFGHLVSEAAATVGLDYWFLCTVSLNEICDIGTSTDRGLTTDYHERFAAEYRRYNPELRVQSPEFFTQFTQFYCSGVFPGFDRRALRESPLVLRWLEHELRYSRLQRRYTRQWFSYLAKEGIGFDDAELDAPASMSSAWKLRLVAQLGALLWDKVKNGATHSFALRPRGLPWRAAPDRPIDFRFTNLNWFSSASARRSKLSPDPASELYRCYQTIARVDFGRCNSVFKAAILPLARDAAFGALVQRLTNSARVRPRKGEPRDLFFLA